MEDGEWHDYNELTEQLTQATHIPLVGRGRNRSRRECAQTAIKQVGARNAYELRFESPPGSKRRLVSAIRKSPTVPPRSNLQSCSRCGRPDLTRVHRLRRIVEFRSPNAGKGQGDQVVARLKSEFLCIPCAEEELHASKATWRRKPPFDQGKQEVIDPGTLTE